VIVSFGDIEAAISMPQFTCVTLVGHNGKRGSAKIFSAVLKENHPEPN